jgi:SAM-dependent methyltransferase
MVLFLKILVFTVLVPGTVAGYVPWSLVRDDPLAFPDESFDVVLSSGAFTQIAKKQEIFEDCRRILKPGGALTSYDWMKSGGDYGEDMLYFFELEGLTYAMDTIENHRQILQDAGYVDIALTDASSWYRREVRREYELLKGELNARVVELIGQESADHFVESWRVMMIICEKGEMKQVYIRAKKP